MAEWQNGNYLGGNTKWAKLVQNHPTDHNDAPRITVYLLRFRLPNCTVSWTVNVRLQGTEGDVTSPCGTAERNTTATAVIGYLSTPIGTSPHHNRPSRCPPENGPRGLEVLLTVIDELNYLSTPLPFALQAPNACHCMRVTDSYRYKWQVGDTKVKRVCNPCCDGSVNRSGCT